MSFHRLICCLIIFTAIVVNSDSFILPRFQSSYAWNTQLVGSGSIRAVVDEDEGASVGDYVKGVHGGKYQFENSGINFMAQEFTESLYSSSQAEPSDDGIDDEPMPRWAQNMGSSIVTPEMCCDSIYLSPGGHPQQVTITNHERTWETFYVKQVCGSNVLPLQFTPSKGKLAPLGGAVNLCDDQNPYSDSAIVSVQCGEEDATFVGQDHYLVIGTEEETWYYNIIVQH